MAWTFTATGGGVNGNNAASLSPITLPGGWQPGDLHIIVFSNFGGVNARTPDAPSGWTAIPSGGYVANGTTYLGVFYRVAEAGDGSVTLNLSGTGVANDTQLSWIFGFRGTAGTLPVIGAVGANSTNASADNITGIASADSVTGDLAILVGAKSNDWNGTATNVDYDALAGQTESGAGNDAGFALFYWLTPGAGALGVQSISDNGGTASNGLGCSIQFCFGEASLTFTQGCVI